MEELLQKLLDSQKKIDHNEDQLTSDEIENELRKKPSKGERVNALIAW